MRTTKEEIIRHINFIELNSDYKVEKDYTEKTTTYNVKLNNVTMAIIKSNNNSDIWDMLEPFWKIAFNNKCDEMKKEKRRYKMNNYDYLTETEKSLFGYIENVPSEYPPYEDVWNEEENEELDALTEKLNIQKKF